MAEHDDALLDEDFASLPDINDEDYELDLNIDDATMSTQESTNEQLSCDLQSSLEDILDLTDFDAGEEYKTNALELESNSSRNESIKQETICSDTNELSDQFDYEDVTATHETGMPENSYGSDSNCQNVSQYEPIVQEHQYFWVDNLEYQRNQSTAEEYNSHNPNRDSIETHSSLQSMNDEHFGPSIYQPCYNFQDQRMNLGFNRSLLHESSVHEPYPINHLANQSGFWYNPDSYANYEYHPTIPRYVHYSTYQNPTFANRVLPGHHPTQMFSGDMPMMTNICQTFFLDSNRQILSNQNISPNYIDPTHYDQFTYENQDEPQYVLNPLYRQSHSNRQKALIIRDSNQIEDRRRRSLNDEFYKTDQFLRKIATKKINRYWKSSSQSRNTMDPYSYFSDIWETKDNQRPSESSPKRQHSPEFLPKTLNLEKQKYKFKKDQNHQKEQKCIKTCKTKTPCSVQKKVSNVKKQSMKLKNICKKKRKNNMQKAKNIGPINNILTSTEISKKVTDLKIKIEEKMDPEMIEYCKKIEEQKRQRDEFLQKKETRRKLLAMGKIGIKIEPITVDDVSQKMNEQETKIVEY